ncbi:MAG: LptF/LptG family permease [Planctomycetota bacterium]
MIRRTDRYVFRVFLGSLAVGVLFATGLLLLTDQFQHFDDLIVASKKLRQKGEPELARAIFPMAVKYYSFEIAIRFFQFAPFVTFFAAVFTAARLHRNHETVALLASGTSLQRGFVAIFAGAVLIAGIQLSFREYLLPGIARDQAVLQTILFKAEPRHVVKNLAVVDSRGNRYTWELYDPKAESGTGFQGNSSDGQKFKNISASDGKFTVGGGDGPLALTNGKLKSIARLMPESSESKAIETLPAEFTLTSRDCEVAARAQGDPGYLSISELDMYAGRMKGSIKYQIALHSAFAFAIANLILPLLGLPCVLRSDRRSTLEGAIIAFGLVIAYYAATLICFQLGEQGAVGAVFAAWLPTVVFGSLGITFFESMRS